MSVEEEVELRDLVAQTLELNGCLPKIRAQLRANLFLALDEDTKISKQQPLLNNKIKSHLERPEGQLMFCLVREFLEYFDLDFTISVFEPESYLGNSYKYEGRQKIVEDLGFKGADENFSGPVLLQLIKLAQTKSKTLKINLTNINGDKSDEQTSMSSCDNEINGHTLSEPENYKEQENSSLKKLTPNKQPKENADAAPFLNATFIKKDAENDDTFNGTSSIEEDINGTDYSIDPHQKSAEEESVSSSPESKSKSEDKIKTVSQKSDKLKSKLELSPLNKTRGSDILPSLYNKDFKEKNSKDLDADFDIKDNYQEEDFKDLMSGSEEYSLSKSEELQHDVTNSNKNTSNSQGKISSKSKNLSNLSIQKANKISHSDNKATSNSIETNLSLDSEISNKSSHSNSKIK